MVEDIKFGVNGLCMITHNEKLFTETSFIILTFRVTTTHI